jgi:hypothetical protein
MNYIGRAKIKNKHKKTMNTPTQFLIRLDGLKLKDEQVKAIAADIDKVVATHLAKLDLGGDQLTIGRPIWLGPGWLGLWIRGQIGGDVATIKSAADIQKTLASLPQQNI